MTAGHRGVKTVKVKQVLLVLSLVAGCSTPALAQQSVADFYKGKTIRIVVGISVGSGYDVTARALQRHWGKHIPGNPTVIVQNQPGAGSRTMVNQLVANGPFDGTVIGAPFNGLPTAPLLQPDGVKFDPVTMVWLGSTNRETQVIVSVAHGAREDVRRHLQERSGDRRPGRRHDAVGLPAGRQHRAQYQVQGHQRLQEHAGHSPGHGARRNRWQRLDQLDDAAVAQRRLGEGKEGQRDRAMGAPEASRPAQRADGARPREERRRPVRARAA